MRMLSWSKRIATRAPHEQSVKGADEPALAENPLERLVANLETDTRTPRKQPPGLTQMRAIVVASQRGRRSLRISPFTQAMEARHYPNEYALSSIG
jgi:hypothetical protein